MRHPLRLLAACLLMLPSIASLAAPKADLWDRWTAHDEKSAAGIDHSAWDRWLKKYVVTAQGKDQAKGSHKGVNLLRYSQVTAEDRQAVKNYLAAMQAVQISHYRRAEQKAYWINLYNAATVEVVLDHYPVDSILKINISPGLLSRGPWGKKLLKVEGEKLSLDDIEHRIVRPVWKDPLTHYGLNCASLSCPNLVPEAFTAANTARLLLDNAREYVNSPRGARIENGKLTASTLYDWYIEDFGGSQDTVIAHLKSLAEPALVEQLSQVSKVSKYDYDWALNESK